MIFANLKHRALRLYRFNKKKFYVYVAALALLLFLLVVYGGPKNSNESNSTGMSFFQKMQMENKDIKNADDLQNVVLKSINKDVEDSTLDEYTLGSSKQENGRLKKSSPVSDSSGKKQKEEKMVKNVQEDNLAKNIQKKLEETTQNRNKNKDKQAIKPAELSNEAKIENDFGDSTDSDLFELDPNNKIGEVTDDSNSGLGIEEESEKTTEANLKTSYDMAEQEQLEKESVENDSENNEIHSEIAAKDIKDKRLYKIDIKLSESDKKFNSKPTVYDPKDSKFTPHIKNDKQLLMINRMFTKLLPILDKSQPTIGYYLREEDTLEAKKKFRLNRSLVTRVHGESGHINIATHDMFNPERPILSRKFLGDSLYLPNDMFEELKRSHKFYTENIPDTYETGTYTDEGIVFIGGGKFSWLSLLSIENLRSVGSKLPIEVMIPSKEDYEPQFCEDYLPQLNAKCLLLFEIFPKMETISGYQLKVLSLLASTFEKVLFLDSDNIPVYNPDSLFISEPFTSNGLILWPDFWRRVTHPLYYDLAGFEISNKRVRNIIDKVTPPELYTTNTEDPDTEIPLHDLEGTIPDSSTESGQLIVDKKIHFKALLLSFYYNAYGPRHYYPLFSQGGSGEGDKETFIAASQFFKLPYYQVNHPVAGIGHWIGSEYNGVGMIQFDPTIDKLNEDKYRERLYERIKEDDYKFDLHDFWNYFTTETSRPMFIHCNFPKFDPMELFVNEKLVDSEGNQWRLYSDQPKFGFDFELKQWKLIEKYFCSSKNPLSFNYLVESNISHDKMCDAVDKRLDYMLKTKSMINP